MADPLARMREPGDYDHETADAKPCGSGHGIQPNYRRYPCSPTEYFRILYPTQQSDGGNPTEFAPRNALVAIPWRRGSYIRQERIPRFAVGLQNFRLTSRTIIAKYDY